MRVSLLTRTGSARAGATRRPGTSLASAQHSWPSGPDPAFRADRSPLQKFVPPRQRKNTRTRSAHADFVSSLPPVKLESPAPLMAEAGGADGRCPSGPCDSRFSLAPAPAARFTGRAGALGSGDSRYQTCVCSRHWCPGESITPVLLSRARVRSLERLLEKRCRLLLLRKLTWEKTDSKYSLLK